MTNLKALLLSLLAVLLLSSCTNNDPIQARKDLLGPGDYGQILATRLTPQGNDTSISKIQNAGRGSYLLAGNLAGTQSQFLIRFDGLSGTVKKAQLVLPIHLFMGTGNDFAPTVHRVTGAWQEDSVTAEKFNNQFEAGTVGNPISVVLDSLRKNVDKDTLWFEMDTTLVKTWIADTTQNLGLLVNTPAQDLLVEYHSRHSLTAVPRLKLVLSQSTGRDTTRYFGASADAFIFTRTNILEPERFYLGNGEQFQTYFAFTPGDSISTNATINKAELQLFIDSTNTVNNQDGFAFVTYVVDSILSNNPLEFKLGLPLSSGTGFISTTDQTLKISLTALVQDWMLRPEANRGFVVQSLTPTRDLLRIACFADRNRPELAPRLLIDYTVPPK